MLEIKPQRKSWKRTIITVVLLAVIAVGIYITLTVLSPGMNLAIVTGKSEQETLKKLEQPIGSGGDRLYIPQINVDIAINEGGDKTVLEKGAWHRKPEIGNPADGGNFVLCAHRFVMGMTPQATMAKSPFYTIGKLAEGDRLVVDYKEKRYQYVINKKQSTAPPITEVEVVSEQSKMTVYSCGIEGTSDGQDVIEAVSANEQ